MLLELVTAQYQAWRDDSEHEDRLELKYRVRDYGTTGTRSVEVGKGRRERKMEDRQI